jgi:hypothetical protein
MKVKSWLLVTVCLAVLFAAAEIEVVHADPIDPTILNSPIGAVIIVFVVTVAIEAGGIYFLLKAFNIIKESVPEYPEYTRRQCFIIALLLNLLTFFFGNYLLLPLLTRLFG